VIRQNLIDIGRVLKTAAADIVTLQETDAPSWWSGGFDHVALLAQDVRVALAFPGAVHGLLGFASTAPPFWPGTPTWRPGPIASQESWATPAKGFLLARFGWYPTGAASEKPVFVDIVSVHLDFSRESIRVRQIAQMRTALEGRNNPLIIMGDFNSEWLADDSVVRKLARRVRSAGL
jgi:endonuclease/exonuclease/phosphatase family metal-dependent hydrolase